MWPFEVINDNGKQKIKVDYHRKNKDFLPKDLLSLLFLKKKENADAYLGGTVTDAVITVPSAFNFSQRQLIKDSATCYGLNILRIKP